MEKPIILASASPRRLKLLKQIGLNPEILISDINETWNGNICPSELSRQLALKKAQACANKVLEGIIIGADTIVTLEGRIYGKPKDAEQAVEMIHSLKGKTHSVITGVAVLEQPGGKFFVDCEETRVVFKDLTDAEIKAYVNWGESWDKAAGYGIQGRGALLVERIEGDYFNVVGLPLQKLNKILGDFHINLLLEPVFQE